MVSSSSDGKELLVWAWWGAYRLNTSSWKVTDDEQLKESSESMRRGSSDSSLVIEGTGVRSDIVCTASNTLLARLPIDISDERYPVAYSTDMKTIAIRGKSVGANNNAYGVYLLKSTGAPFNRACNEAEAAAR